jgi:hypothetical protein
MTTTRRAALTALAGVSALAMPAVAIAAAAPPNADAELVALAAEIERLNALGEAIYAERVDPFEEKFNALLDHALLTQDRTKWNEAFAYSHEVGREAAIREQQEVDNRAGSLWARMLAIPAATQAGKIAKVRILLTFVHNDEWRGPTADLDWEKEQTRALLGQFAGMTEEELAAI